MLRLSLLLPLRINHSWVNIQTYATRLSQTRCSFQRLTNPPPPPRRFLCMPPRQVYDQRPFAFLQIILAIFAVEVYGNRKQQESPMGGDLGFDPLGLKPSGDEAWERVQLRELKNGRLAMFAILGMIVQEHITGVGVLEKVDALAGLA